MSCSRLSFTRTATRALSAGPSLACVGQLFFARRDVESSHASLMQIKVWLARGPNCPHAVESTASLLEIVLRDTEAVGTSQRPSQQELRLAYSMALIRWVVCQFRSVGLLLT